jgi:hypothetical protein
VKRTLQGLALRFSSKIRQWILLTAQAVYLAAPIAHGFLHHEPIDGQDTGADQHGGPWLSAACGQDCNDPTHHHDRGHAGHQCVFCKVQRNAHTFDSEPGRFGVLSSAERLTPPGMLDPTGAPDGDPIPIRAPPSAAIS